MPPSPWLLSGPSPTPNAQGTYPVFYEMGRIPFFPIAHMLPGRLNVLQWKCVQALHATATTIHARLTTSTKQKATSPVPCHEPRPASCRRRQKHVGAMERSAAVVQEKKTVRSPGAKFIVEQELVSGGGQGPTKAGRSPASRGSTIGVHRRALSDRNDAGSCNTGPGGPASPKSVVHRRDCGPGE